VSSNRCYIFVSFRNNVGIIEHYEDTPFWFSADTNKNDLEWPWMPDSTKSAISVRQAWRTNVVAFGTGHAWLNEHGPWPWPKMWPINCSFWAHEVSAYFRRGLLHRGRRTGVEPLKLVIFHLITHVISQVSWDVWPFMKYIIMKANGFLMSQR